MSFHRIDFIVRLVVFVFTILRFLRSDLKHEKYFQEQRTIKSHNSRAGKPSNLSPVSSEIISDSVEL